jgi:HEAT repeats
MAALSIQLLWFSASLALLSLVCVVCLALRRPVLTRSHDARVREESRVLAYLLAENRARPGKQFVRVKWPKDKKLVARTLNCALECDCSEGVWTVISRAEKMGVRRGIGELILSSHAHDRLIAARLLGHFPKSRRALVRLARTDVSVIVRAAALQSLGALGYQPKARLWSRWMKLGKGQLHPVVRLLLVNPNLISEHALEVAARDAVAPEDARIWAVGAMVKRDPEGGCALLADLVRSASTPAIIVSAILQFIDDPLFLTQLHGYLVKSPDWQVREALAQAALRTYAYTLMPQVTHLASDEDWRVRAAALLAMKRLGGFDNVPMPAAMRDLQMADPWPPRQERCVALAS